VAAIGALTLFAAYLGGLMWWASELRIGPPVSWTALPSLTSLYGGGMAMLITGYLAFASPRVPWSWKVSLTACLVVMLAPGATLALNRSAEPTAPLVREAEVTGILYKHAARGMDAWFLVVEDSMGDQWNVSVTEEWTTLLPAGSVGTLKVHRGLLGIRWTSMHDVVAPTPTE
jgi:hypothetical protein